MTRAWSSSGSEPASGRARRRPRAGSRDDAEHRDDGDDGDDRVPGDGPHPAAEEALRAGECGLLVAGFGGRRSTSGASARIRAGRVGRCRRRMPRPSRRRAARCASCPCARLRAQPLSGEAEQRRDQGERDEHGDQDADGGGDAHRRQERDAGDAQPDERDHHGEPGEDRPRSRPSRRRGPPTPRVESPSLSWS